MVAVTGKTSFEIEVGLTGTFSAGCAAWGGSKGERPINPPEPDSIEDIAIERLSAIRSRYEGGRLAWTSVNLCEGVDMNSPDVRKLLDNILDFIGDDAEVALLEGAE